MSNPENTREESRRSGDRRIQFDGWMGAADRDLLLKTYNMKRSLECSGRGVRASENENGKVENSSERNGPEKKGGCGDDEDT